jgi:hypothetical protein
MKAYFKSFELTPIIRRGVGDENGFIEKKIYRAYHKT